MLSRLGIGALSEEVAQAGVSSLFARGLLESGARDEIAPTQVILAALGLIADSPRRFVLAVVGEDTRGTSHVHVVGSDGVPRVARADFPQGRGLLAIGGGARRVQVAVPE